MAIVSSGILGIVGGGVKLATLILQKSVNEQNRKYIDEYVHAEKMLLAERSKPMEDQHDNVVEHFEAKLKILMDAAEQEYIKQAGQQ